MSQYFTVHCWLEEWCQREHVDFTPCDKESHDAFKMPSWDDDDDRWDEEGVEALGDHHTSGCDGRLVIREDIATKSIVYEGLIISDSPYFWSWRNIKDVMAEDAKQVEEGESDNNSD